MLRPTSSANAEAGFDEVGIAAAQPGSNASNESGSDDTSNRSFRRVSTRHGQGAAVANLSDEGAGVPLPVGELANGPHATDVPASSLAADEVDSSPWELPLIVLILVSLAGIAAILLRESTRS
jgi:hypothetical protein